MDVTVACGCAVEVGVLCCVVGADVVCCCCCWLVVEAAELCSAGAGSSSKVLKVLVSGIEVEERVSTLERCGGVVVVDSDVVGATMEL